jgi:hypothetical protein
VCEAVRETGGQTSEAALKSRWKFPPNIFSLLALAHPYCDRCEALACAGVMTPEARSDQSRRLSARYISVHCLDAPNASQLDDHTGRPAWYTSIFECYRCCKRNAVRIDPWGLTSCFRFAALSSTANWQISFVSGFLDFARTRVRSSVLCERRPRVCSGSAGAPVRILGYFGSFTANRSTCSIFGG